METDFRVGGGIERRLRWKVQRLALEANPHVTGLGVFPHIGQRFLHDPQKLNFDRRQQGR